MPGRHPDPGDVPGSRLRPLPCFENVPERRIVSRGRVLMAPGSAVRLSHGSWSGRSSRSQAPPLTAMKTGGIWLQHCVARPAPHDRPECDDAELLPVREGTRGTLALSLQPVRPVGSGQAHSVGRSRAGRRRDQRQEALSESRCITCHTVEGKGNGSAPELSRIASSATRGWLLAFLRRPSTPRRRCLASPSRRPNHGLLRTWRTSFRDLTPRKRSWWIRVNQTLAENGEKLFRRAGCFACHLEPTVRGEVRTGPERRRRQEGLVARFRAPDGSRPGRSRPGSRPRSASPGVENALLRVDR